MERKLRDEVNVLVGEFVGGKDVGTRVGDTEGLFNGAPVEGLNDGESEGYPRGL